jgi:NADH-quinone oxidoreductase subunit G
MTTTQESAVAVDMITVVIDGFEVSVPKGTLVIRAAEKLGIQSRRYRNQWPSISKATSFMHHPG